MSKAKSKGFIISKKLLWEAFKKVKANRGSAGIDFQSLKDFEVNLKDNLYRIWNRMSSGSYFPPPVREVEIPKADGGVRKLGIPTVSDRIAQMAAKLILEPEVDPIFHEDSYGYRPRKSAHQAVETARRRCWKVHWVIDLDIKGFFDCIDHELMMKAVRKHTEVKWVLLYVERWLKAEVVNGDGVRCTRGRGTPQGGVISPLLANLFLHYTFDAWMKRTYPELKFERYADDILVHCHTSFQAERALLSIKKRLEKCQLSLNSQKTKIVFCPNTLDVRYLKYPTSFDFLGFTFRQRSAKGPTGNIYDGFLPAISYKSQKTIKQKIKTWHVGRASDLSLKDLSRMYNPTLRGWVNYYGKFYPQAMKTVRQYWHDSLLRWAKRKYKRFKGFRGNAGKWIYSIEQREPNLFAIWQVFHSKTETG